MRLPVPLPCGRAVGWPVPTRPRQRHLAAASRKLARVSVLPEALRWMSKGHELDGLSDMVPLDQSPT